MIIRKLTQAIRQQNWFTAVLEILIIVIGIFIGLQVDDWNQQRIDRVEERTFLQRIHDELDDTEILDKRSVQNTIELREALFDAIEIISGRVEKEQLSDRQCEAVYQSSLVILFLSDIPSLDSLIAQGRVGIISDEELRSALIKFSQRKDTIERVAGGTRTLSRAYPEIFRVTLEPLDETRVSTIVQCDLATMLANPAFQNDFYENAKRQITINRTGTIPLREDLEKIHLILDARLGIDHDI